MLRFDSLRIRVEFVNTYLLISAMNKLGYDFVVHRNGQEIGNYPDIYDLMRDLKGGLLRETDTAQAQTNPDGSPVNYDEWLERDSREPWARNLPPRSRPQPLPLSRLKDAFLINLAQGGGNSSHPTIFIRRNADEGRRLAQQIWDSL